MWQEWVEETHIEGLRRKPWKEEPPGIPRFRYNNNNNNNNQIGHCTHTLESSTNVKVQ